MGYSAMCRRPARLSVTTASSLANSHDLHIGVAAPMASITLVRTVSFSIYQRSKYAYSAWLKKNFGIDVLAHVNKRGTYPNLSSIACFGAAGATAGSCITLIACKYFRAAPPPSRPLWPRQLLGCSQLTLHRPV